MMTEEQLRAEIAANPNLAVTLRKKFLRTQVRLEHSMAADIEIHAGLQTMQQLGTDGKHAQLESTSFDDVFGAADSATE
jgi:hypothetical protein